MGIPEKILESINDLPEVKQIEVLDFVEYLKLKSEKENFKTWSEMSISAAMKDLVDEPSQYSINDLKEIFS